MDIELNSKEKLSLEVDRMESLIKLYQLKIDSDQDIVDYALEEGVRLTNSEVGYLHFFNEELVELKLFTWSKKVHEQCTAAKADHYPLEKAGIWADCIRLKRAVIHNSYDEFPYKRGIPEGHFPITRHMSVPVFDGDTIAAVAGVGNKKEPYDDMDVRQLSLFVSGVWRIVKQRRVERELKKREHKIKTIFRAAPIGIGMVKGDRILIEVNDTMCQMLGYKPQELIGKKTRMFYPDDHTYNLVGHQILNYDVLKGSGETETQWITKDEKIIDVLVKGAPIDANDIFGKGIVFTAMDITEQKRAKKTIAEVLKGGHELIDRLESRLAQEGES